MTDSATLECALFLLVVIFLVKPIGTYLALVFENGKTFLDPVLEPVEQAIYRLCKIDPKENMSWSIYLFCFIAFSLVGTILLCAILRLQLFLPYFFPEYITTAMTPDLAMNTAISFATTTTWQAYGGETTMSYFSQVFGLVVQNFLAGASGLAVGIAFIRGFLREQSHGLGNFWVDVVRAILWVLLPGAMIGSILLVWQGVPMNFHPYVKAATLEGGLQTIAQGPVAVLELIKNLGTDGGGFFNANGAHPYENPTPFTNFLEMLSIVILPAALTFTFGSLIKRPRHGWLLFVVMMILFVAGLLFCAAAEHGGSPYIHPNMEGKEIRFGIADSALAAVVTSNGATGSTNSMHDSFMPIGGMVALVNMLLGEVVFGGLGTGLYSIVMVALLATFLAGLMVGRTPVYLGQSVGPYEIKLIALYQLVPTLVILPLTAAAVMIPMGLAGLTTNTGPHGFEEIFFAYTSCFANNGQAFAGLSANNPFYNISTMIVMIAGRFGLAIPALALAGKFATQTNRVDSVGQLSAETPLFAILLIGTVIIIGGLSYLPALALGPIVEQLMMMRS